MEYLLSFGNYASNLLTLVLKISYPTYASFKAIRSEEGNDDTTWLIYWVVVAVESFIGSYLLPFVSWVPFFMIARVLFYVWLQIPIFNGSVILFNKFVKPFFEENQEVLNEIIPGDDQAAAEAKLRRNQSILQAYQDIYDSIGKTKEQ
ncbi:TB2/DP1, HVA22 family protein [Tritrichomonas foetus]|uniref:TB2/DP1, HVA22 family protein n=1 Tax=Tritrichomonas foetus TaxID=1144522 RepID=A0A1J4JB31_9EUKA|nr:TB2/DP1, HVA22 family protein [Tritrichomonas foetus]|eukprot:OHS94460.1 TB2/DP1, HVA22 family protein [Tritrichomonas foetus]